ncbi:hypothetical protein FRC07_003778 [Ceratobasidium sp. 392]|nr:hypothetical protein FRC07_003778 [Ceratobasidium sp. 392]
MRRSARIAAKPSTSSQGQAQDLTDLLGPSSDESEVEAQRGRTSDDETEAPPKAGSESDLCDTEDDAALDVAVQGNNKTSARLDNWSGAKRTIPKKGLRVPTEETGFPGVFTDNNMDAIHMTLLTEYGMWYCETCRQNPSQKKRVIGLGTRWIRKHVLKVHNMSLKDPGVKQALESLDDYGAWDGLSPTPVPKAKFVPPFPFLEKKTIKSTKNGVTPQACGLCPGQYPYIWINGATRNAHFNEKHNIPSLEEAVLGPEYPIVQSFTSQDRHNRYFPVNEALAALPDVQEDAEREFAEALTSYMQFANLAHIDPITQMGPSQGLPAEIPFINAQGWTELFKNQDPKDLNSLTAVPAKKDPLYMLLAASVHVYKQWQAVITGTNLKFRRQWIDAGDGPDNAFITQFNKLQSKEAIQSYARHLSRLMLLIVRTRTRKKSKAKDKYIPFLTPDQEAGADELISKLANKASTRSLADSVHKLAIECFAPSDPGLTAKSQHHDITHMYIALAAINSDGSYRTPAEMVRSTTATQYSMRAALLLEATNQAHRKFRGDVTACFKHYRTYLMDMEEVTPFSTLRTLRRLLLDTVASTAGYGYLHWAGKDKSHCSYKGHTFEVTKVQLMAQTMLERTEELIKTKVLKNIPLKDIGYMDPSYLDLQDEKHERANHYSVWNDPKNIELHEMREKLLVAFTTHHSMKDWFCFGVKPDGSLDWKNDRRMEWLRDVREFIESLAVSTHFYGGQGRRAKEFCGVCVCNVEARPRDMFLHGEDLLFIIGYSKTAAITLRDRMDVHSLPPRLTRLFFLFNSLVRPLLVQWTKELLDPAYITSELEAEGGASLELDIGQEEAENVSDRPEQAEDEDGTDDGLENEDFEYVEDFEEEFEFEGDPEEMDSVTKDSLNNHQPPHMRPSTIQRIFAFASLGSPLRPTRFSDLIAKTTSEFLGVELRVQAWRHVTTAIQRDIVHLLDDTPVDTVFTAQRAHSDRVSRTWYAVDENDRRLVGAGSIEKYMKASQIWQDWLDGRPPCSTTDAEELKAGVTGLESTVSALKSEVTELRTEVSELKSELKLTLSKLGKALELLEKLAA